MEKLIITPIDSNNNTGEPIPVQFNPTSYAIDKKVTWSPDQTYGVRDAPVLKYGSSGSRLLKLDLFFDVTESPDSENPGRPADVRRLTGKLVALTKRVPIGGGEAVPPFVRIDWGGAGPKNSDFPFIGAVDSLTQSFTLFSADGRPLRASVSMGITESSNPKQDKLLEKDGSIEQVIKTLSRTRLDQVSGATAGRPTDWRRIAQANGIDNPLKLVPGSFLKVKSGPSGNG